MRCLRFVQRLPALKSVASLTQTGGALIASDARFFQIGFQIALLTLGVLIRDFTLSLAQFAFALLAALLTQTFWLRVFRIQGVGYLSALITACGISLLLRADTLWVHPLAASLAISSKFLVRVHGKHVFNPANLGVGLALIMLPGTWVSPGQWGFDLGVAVWLVALGGLVAYRAARNDVAWLYLAAFLGFLLVRLFYLGYTPERVWEIFLHEAFNGALLLFAFFMVSDPMTLPNRPFARRLHVVIVALAAFGYQFLYYQPNGSLWALLCLAPCVPLWDTLFPAEKPRWRSRPADLLHAAPLQQEEGRQTEKNQESA